MTLLGQYRELLVMHLRIYRAFAVFMMVLQAALTLGFVFGFGFIIPDVTDATALYLTTGAATANLVTIGLVALPQVLAEAKAQGRMEYFLTLPVSREAYLAANATVAFLFAMPGFTLALILGSLYYDVPLAFDPLIIAAIPLAALSLAGLGVAMAILSPHLQVTNALTQLVIFYVFFFAPVLIPADQLPGFLQVTADFMPPTYAADALRGTLTDLPGTHTGRSLAALLGFAAASLAISAAVVRRRA